ncbi:hypothetical protein FRC07_000320 [Ceratobasidium sp. 392]|nr:hypothetical protein FRC07_000320 [Ceratobasidium sp. 392]
MNALIFAFILYAVSVSAAPSLVLRSRALASAVDINSLVIKTTLKNTGDKPIKLLNSPNSALTTYKTDIFDMSSHSGSPSFIGIRVKYSPTLVATSNLIGAFIVLAPGQSVEKIHALAGAYDFTKSGEGTYSLRTLDLFDYVDSSGDVRTIRAASDSHQFKITGQLSALSSSPRRRLAKRDINYYGCSTIQKAQIQRAATLSNAYVQRAKAYFRNNRLVGGVQYTKWFGEMDPMRYELVRTHFWNINNQATSNWYDCTCTYQDVSAYVYPDHFGMVYLCPPFWRLPEVGIDSQAGTIVHENSHFNLNGGTRDFAYGTSQTLLLAALYPDWAVRNAANHQYL